MVTSAATAPFAPFVDITLEDWNRTISVDLSGTFHCLQATLPDMIAAQWGRIVTISSSSGQIGSPRQAHYAAAKGGVIALTKTIAREYAADGITANTIPPFCVETPMLRAAQASGDVPGPEAMRALIPSGRLGSLDDIGATCAFLCSEAAGYITGQTIGVNGGAVL
jgi:NAD(P)-dependent dehydrogenase (short-subunit alcohol dehydrogenase family)